MELGNRRQCSSNNSINSHTADPTNPPQSNQAEYPVERIKMETHSDQGLPHQPALFGHDAIRNAKPEGCISLNSFDMPSTGRKVYIALAVITALSVLSVSSAKCLGAAAARGFAYHVGAALS
jgi:hypothetical protein